MCMANSGPYTYSPTTYTHYINSGPQHWKRSVFIPILKKSNAKQYSNYRTIALISHASKAMPKILKPGFNGTWTMNFQFIKLDLEKAEEPEIKLSMSVGSSKKQESSRKSSTSALLITPKPLTVFSSVQSLSHVQLFATPWTAALLWSQQTVEKDGNTRSPYLPSEKCVWRSRSNS